PNVRARLVLGAGPVSRSGRQTAAVRCQEGGDPAYGFFDLQDRGEDHETEVVRRRPVEGGAVGDKDLLVPKEVQDELLVTRDRVKLRIQAGKQIHRPGRGYAGDTGNCREEPVGEVPLVAQPAAR